MKKVKALKIIVTIFCVLGFLINSSSILKSYFIGTLVNSLHLQVKFDQGQDLMMPTMVLCEVHPRPKHRFGFDIFTPASIDAMTYNSKWAINSLLQSVHLPISVERKGLTYEDFVTVDKIYTRLYGTCYAITFHQPVREMSNHGQQIVKTYSLINCR